MKQSSDASPEARNLLVVVGRNRHKERLLALAHQAEAELREVASAAELLTLRLSPAAVLLPLESAPEEWTLLRSSPDLAATPLLGLVDEASELAFADTFARGGEDLLILGESDDTLAKLRAVPPAQPPPETRARSVLVVGQRPGWRGEMARRLRNAGVGVRFAQSSEEALEFCHGGSTTLVLVDAMENLDEGKLLIERLRQRGHEVPVLLSVAPAELGKGSALLQGIPGVAVHDAFGLADALLFVVNEMTAGAVRERRLAPRMLFGTCVWLRQAGGEQDRIGYSYTVSEGGLFVRSMAPFPVGTPLWVEMNPPRQGRRVRLAATVVWARGVGPQSAAISPPGAGLRIDGGLPGEWELYREGCRALLAPEAHREPSR
jgi:CheY-like chemotaxis protein/Tfp pilus assembly protein PilZ